MVPCLSADTLAPASGTYALSSWPLVDRLVTPYATRLWSVQAAANVARALVRVSDAAEPAVREELLTLLTFLSRGSSWSTAGTSFAGESKNSVGVLAAVELVADRAAEDARKLHEQHQREVPDASRGSKRWR